MRIEENMYRTLAKSVEFLARAMALAGGAVLAVLIVMTVASIIGRALIGLGLGPIPGDFELVEIGVGFAIFAFLPWCQLKQGHARVDLFQGAMSPRLNKAIDFGSDVLMAVAASLIAWRLILGLFDKKGYFETTFILQFPIWMAYAACAAGALVFVVVAAFCILRSGRVLIGLGND
jgi:TRAP-type C4-dicarboxylate transport system permease small subunit